MVEVVRDRVLEVKAEIAPKAAEETVVVATDQPVDIFSSALFIKLIPNITPQRSNYDQSGLYFNSYPTLMQYLNDLFITKRTILKNIDDFINMLMVR